MRAIDSIRKIPPERHLPVHTELLRLLHNPSTSHLFAPDLAMADMTPGAKAAYRATIKRIAPNVPYYRQLRYVYAALQNWPQRVFASYCAAAQIANGKLHPELRLPRGKFSAIELPIVKTLVDTGCCVPLQLRRRSRASWQHGLYCENFKWCPWCHYRRIAGTNTTQGLYAQVARYGNAPTAMVTALWTPSEEDDPKDASHKYRQNLLKRLNRTIKPEAFWIVHRLNVRETDARDGRFTFDVNVLAVGGKVKPGEEFPGLLLTPRHGRGDLVVTAAPKAIPARTAAGQLLHRFYPYQVDLLTNTLSKKRRQRVRAEWLYLLSRCTQSPDGRGLNDLFTFEQSTLERKRLNRLKRQAAA